MAKHTLSLNVNDLLNTCILRIEDTSVYDPNLPVTCPTLEITPPGFWKASVLLDRTPNFIANLTACDLGIQTSNCGNTANVLVDGLYIIRWSVAPNNIVFVEYNHLRISTILTTYQKVLCALDLMGCSPDIETQQKIQELQFIRTLIDAAKAKVEVCHNPQRGLEIYNYAHRLLNKLAKTYNCAC